MKVFYNFLAVISVLLLIAVGGYVGFSEGIKSGEERERTRSLIEKNKEVVVAREKSHNLGYEKGHAAGRKAASPQIESRGYERGLVAGYKKFLDTLDSSVLGVGDSSEKVLRLLGQPLYIKEGNARWSLASSSSSYCYFYSNKRRDGILPRFVEIDKGHVVGMNWHCKDEQKHRLEYLRGLLYTSPK